MFDQKEHREKRRKAILDRRVPKRICPKCKRVVLESRRWIVQVMHVHDSVVRRVGACCKSCYWGLK